MAELSFTFDGRPLSAAAGSSVAAALLAHGITTFRTSTSGQPRGPLCGMGICFECRVTINGQSHQKACQTPVTAGMAVTSEGAGR